MTNIIFSCQFEWIKYQSQQQVMIRKIDLFIKQYTPY